MSRKWRNILIWALVIAAVAALIFLLPKGADNFRNGGPAGPPPNTKQLSFYHFPASASRRAFSSRMIFREESVSSVKPHSFSSRSIRRSYVFAAAE